MTCPYCLSSRLRVWHQDKDILYQCAHCHSNIKVFANECDIYDESYFQSHYEEVYGKSYEEDEPMIRTYAARRLREIRRLVPEGRLVDVGAAYGFFLDEARIMGYEVSGVEIHDASLRYIQDRFGYPTYRSLEEVPGDVDVVTVWFTLEHMRDVEAFMKSLVSKLRAGGCAAFGLPNGYGAFARFASRAYFSRRPVEHFTEPSLKGMYTLLKRYGFRVVHEEIFGLHPDRVGLPDTPFWRHLEKTLRLGDTFEVYAIRE